jgi:hypothetical protein
MISFLFYSHKDYSDLWGQLEESGKIIPFMKYLAVNEEATGPFPAWFEIIRYKDSLSYSENCILLKRLKTNSCVSVKKYLFGGILISSSGCYF